MTSQTRPGFDGVRVLSVIAMIVLLLGIAHCRA